MSAPVWRLLSVLVSTVPLSPALALTLVEAARACHLGGSGSQAVAGDALTGRVDDLGKEVLLGTIAGPLFEARLETARGAGLVRFLLTREALDEPAEAAPVPARAPRYLN